MHDCYLALEVLHCTPGEFYRRTTPKERVLMRIYLAYKHEQQAFADDRRRQHAEMQAQLDRQHAGVRTR
jgi:hypothetical protein